MSLNPRCYALSQVSYLVNTINKKNYKSSCAEIASVRCLLCVLYLMLTMFSCLAGREAWANCRLSLIQMSYKLCGIFRQQNSE